MILFLDVLEITLAILIIWFFVTQMILPVLRGTPVLPIFRKEAKLQAEMEKVNQEIIEKKMEEEIKTTKQKEGVN
jgi:hypothetical protein